jgi:hypothetical protein
MDTQTDRQKGDLISFLLFFKNKEIGLKVHGILITKTSRLMFREILSAYSEKLIIRRLQLSSL